ncbi:serine/threonine protein phosphatase [Comamonas thiooxydans]|uniref:bifunctional protein-serine/threonine kinase/phosphatase n=1 Tax=Comamonas thiooxydans TaxID=363952 RepID=UPI000510169E|nr:bifunctional protein-serine/threonine kinase/phosphatase [Comamonas thiooxydans]KGG81779.1 serine/threonine phosphatase [Comamonas thiooxydans]OAD85718.1 serine/threonine protein phosphatase [Comamonas thiooxydans]
MPFELDIGWVSRSGRAQDNEDFAAVQLQDESSGHASMLAAVADGVSAGGWGREAAQTTVTCLARDFFCTPATWEPTVALDRIVGAQNAWLYGINRRRQPAYGLTTLTALVLRGQSFTLAHVGDTRAYLLRQGQIEQLTEDHVMGGVDFAHRLARAIGLEDRVSIDYRQGEVVPGDIFVLLSDGIHNDVKPREFAQWAGEGGAQSLAERLADAAWRNGSRDNLTAVVVRVLGVKEATLDDTMRRAQSLPPLPLLRPGSLVDGLRVEALVADSGIYRVYRVLDERSGQRHALKTLHTQRAHDRQEWAALAHEAWVAGHLQTGAAARHLVRLHAAPVDLPSAFYLLYEWVEGETLSQWLERRHQPGVDQVLAIGQQAARVLGYLHRQGVIHRDVKPANLHCGVDGVLRLLDLGVALTGREPPELRALHAGTASYMNPEQWDDPPVPASAGSDLFALGVTLYQLLTSGRLPYGEVIAYQRGRYWRDPIPPSRHNPQVPIWLDAIVLKAIARDPAQRFETAEEMLLALERGAARPLLPQASSPLLERDPAFGWKTALAFSVVLNVALLYWLLFLPR